MRHQLRTLFILACVGIGASCEKEPVMAPDPSAPLPGAVPVDLVAIQRFSIELSVTGKFIPGQSVTVRGSVVANLSTADAEVRVVFPELEGFRAAGPSTHLPLNTSLSYAVLDHVALARAERHAFSTSVVVPSAGYYRVVVTVRKRSDEPAWVNGEWTQDVAYREAWFWIDEQGGRLTGEFMRSALPDTVAPFPGPRQMKVRSLTPGVGPRAGVSATGPVEGCDVYHVTYWNADANGGAGAYEQLDSVYAEWDITDDQTGQVINNQGQQIGSDGEIIICTWQGVGYNGTIQLTTYAGDMVSPNTVAFFGGGNTQQYYGYYELVASSSPSRVFVNLRATKAGSQGLLGYNRPSILVVIGGTTTQYFHNPVSGFEKIDLRSVDVWGEVGIFALAHEYGHAVHEMALGGLAGYGDCPESGHAINGSYNLGCAWKEGFADFHGVYTRRDALTGSYASDYAIEHNVFYSSGDGSIVEGAVSAFLYDLVDGPNDPDAFDNTTDGDDDAVQYPGSYVANLMRTCWVTATPSHGENGIDDLTYCLERQVDPAVTGSSVYFPTRGADPWAESEGATEPPTWSQGAIRALWTHNLYGQ